MTMSKRCAWTLSALLALAPATAADVSNLRGQLQAESQMFPGFSAVLQEFSRASDFYRVDVRVDGSFEFRSVPVGDYTLRIADDRGETICQQHVILTEHNP